MIAKILGRDEVNAAMAVALTGAIAMLLAKGDGTLSLGRVAARILSNPIPRTAPEGTSRTVPAELRVTA